MYLERKIYLKAVLLGRKSANVCTRKESMKLSIKQLQEHLKEVAELYREDGSVFTAEDYARMTQVLRLIEVEAPQLIKRVEDIWN